MNSSSLNDKYLKKYINKEIKSTKQKITGIKQYFEKIIDYSYHSGKVIKVIKQFPEHYNNIVCAHSLMKLFPNVINKDNYININSISTRLRVLSSMKTSWKHKVKCLSAISSDYMSYILPYTGINMIIDNIPYLKMETIDIYNLINDNIDVVSAMFIQSEQL